jgi:hypothetical protein
MFAVHREPWPGVEQDPVHSSRTWVQYLSRHQGDQSVGGSVSPDVQHFVPEQPDDRRTVCGGSESVREVILSVDLCVDAV